MAQLPPKFASFPEHLRRLILNTQGVTTLVDIHSALARKETRTPQWTVLHKSAVVLLVACWEAFIEDLAQAAFEAMLDGASNPSTFPNAVLVKAADTLVGAEDRRAVWALAGDGWRSVLRTHRDKVLEMTIGKLNTPRPKQIDKLFEDLIGLRHLSHHLRWAGMSNLRALILLDDLVSRRGDIAHRVTTSRSVNKRYVASSVHLVQRAAAVSSNVVQAFVRSKIRRPPWVPVSYGRTG